MKRFIEGADRSQSTFFPERLEDWIGEDNPVRVVDVFVDELDLGGLGFGRVAPLSTGRPSYHPSVLLKLYIYGYLNRVQSSRRLEREAGRNVEVMWLTGRLVPDHKTIADFRKNNGRAIRKVCVRFVALCRRLELFTEACVAIDGAKFKAVNTRDRNVTRAKVKRRMEQIEESVSRYLHQLDSADRQEPSLARATKTVRLTDKIATLRDEMRRLEALETEMLATPDQQISLTDADARSMATSGRGSGMVGYNVQSAVDTKHHLIVAHEVTNVGTDRSQLSHIAKRTKAALGTDKLDVVADRGYYKSEEILACDKAGITVTLPKPYTSGIQANGRFGKQDFRYVAEDDVYICPAGERLDYHYTNVEKGLTLRRYWNNICRTCAIKDQCTAGKERRITRWEHEHVLEAVQQRLDEHPEKMRPRRETVEHPFGTIKYWMGYTHFQMKTL
ncbi:MAG: IS1182 family transposase, partial [Rhodospirillaceae bacterium]|nr:IS1182 family transposase [Rhodospirillaceae bacterium]